MSCINCNKVLINDNIYCSNYCQKDYQYKQYILKWKKNKVNGMRGKYQISMHIQRYLREKHNNSCCICGWHMINPYTNHVPLEIEHIDGDYSNNTENNLLLICPNCHSLTATYKGANRGNGRKERLVYSLYGNPELGSKEPSVETLYGVPKS